MFDCVNNEDVERPFVYFNKISNINSLNSPPTTENLNLFVGKHIYQRNIIIEEIDVVIRTIRKHWWQLQNTILSDTVLLDECIINTAAEEINLYFQLIINCLVNCDCLTLKQRYIADTRKSLKTLFNSLVIPIAELEDEILLKKLTNSSIFSKNKTNSNKCSVAAVYYYFHTFLDIQFYLLLIDFICNKPISELEEKLKQLLNDFIIVSLKSYQQNNESAFLCNCIKNFWLFTQYLTEYLSPNSDSFWKIFNSITENLLENGSYVLWLLKDVANLQSVDIITSPTTGVDRIRPNYILLETTLKNILTNSQLTINCLKCLEPILCGLWLKSAKIDTYQILWDYFSKHLNTSANKINSNNYTWTEFTELLDKILWYPKDCEEEFEFFLGMLIIHLKQHPEHWAKMKGRIYSQLGPNKIKDLNDVGILHVSLLYLALTQINFEDLMKKLLGFMENLSQEKKQTRLVWGIYSSIIIKFVRENRVIDGKVALQQLTMLQEAVGQQKTFYLIKNFINNDFDYIIQHSTNLQLNQWLLIDSWTQKYLMTCSYADLLIALKILLKTIELIEKAEAWSSWESTFQQYIYPTLKCICNSSLTAPEISGTLAAKITLLSPSLMDEAFNFFNGESIVARVSASFLCVILKNSFIMSSGQETIAIKSWVKVCLLTKDNHQQMMELTIYITKLDRIPGFIKIKLITAKDPLTAFTESLSSDIKQHMQSMQINKLCEICYGDADRWITQYLSQPEISEAIVLRIYTCIAITFYQIGPLLYDRHKTTSPVLRLLAAMLLSTEVLIGKTIHPWVLQGIKKTWHLFFEAILKLNSPGDCFIERTLKDLVVKYIPHFTIVDCPLVKCLDNPELASVILEKMSSAYLKQPIKELDGNVFKALRIIQDYVQSTTSLDSLKLIINKTLYGLFEVVMFHNQRNTALTAIKSITNSMLYSQVVNEFGQIIILITEKHLAFNTLNYFQLMNILAKFIPNDLKKLVNNIKQQIAVVERMRGVGFDKSLRQHLEKLEATLLQTV